MWVKFSRKKHNSKWSQKLWGPTSMDKHKGKSFLYGSLPKSNLAKLKPFRVVHLNDLAKS